MRAGILAAIGQVEVNGRTIEYLTLDDSYTPEKTIESTNRSSRGRHIPDDR
jgi:branched-chain amino acid transport system substrate-binding protein